MHERLQELALKGLQRRSDLPTIRKDYVFIMLEEEMELIKFNDRQHRLEALEA